MNYLFALLAVISAYLIGSINFAVIFSNRFSKVDVRDYGSGNAGTTNVMRVSGAKAGTLTFIADALKGAVSAAIGYLCFKYACQANATELSVLILTPSHGAYICGLACTVGHCWPIFFQFRGGKAAATSVGIFAVCCWPTCVAALAAFAISFILSRIVSLSTLIAAAVMVIGCTVSAFTGFYKGSNPMAITVITIIIGIIVFLRHKSNIVRLAHGEENKLVVKTENRE